MFLLQSQSEARQKTVAAYQLYLSNVYFVTLLFVLF